MESENTTDSTPHRKRAKNKWSVHLRSHVTAFAISIYLCISVATSFRETFSSQYQFTKLILEDGPGRLSSSLRGSYQKIAMSRTPPTQHYTS